MKIGVICAMEIEASGLIELMSDAKTEICLGIRFTTGRIENKETIVALSGIGKVNAAAATTLMIERFGADKVVNTGICGGTCGTGKTIVAQSVVQYDFDTTAAGDELGRLEGFDSPYIKCTLDVSSVECDLRGVIASGDKFIASPLDVERLKTAFGAIGFDMESGAVAQICTRANREFAIIRVVSDGGDPLEYEQFKRLAAQKSISAALSLIKNV